MKAVRWIIGGLAGVACVLPHVELVDSTDSGGGGGKSGNGGSTTSGGSAGDSAGETSSGGSAGKGGSMGTGGSGGDIGGGGEAGGAGTSTGGDSGEAGMAGTQAGRGGMGGRPTGGAGGAGAGGATGGAGAGGAMAGAGAGGTPGGTGAGGAGGTMGGTGGAGAGGGGTGGAAGACTFPTAESAWPDSPTIFCSDGSIAGTCPSSGQTFGQDGSYARTTNTYIDTNGVVSDALLGVEWMRAFSGPEIFSNASDYCAMSMFGGRTGWRLPTRLELVSIVDYGRFDPVLDTSVFNAPGGTYRGFWTRTAHATLGQDHWIVNSQEGIVVSRANILPTQVRCVRGSSMMPVKSELAGCSIIFDSFTGLGFQKIPSGQTFGWAGALAHCETLEQDGFYDWRLPSVKELQTIVDASVVSPAIDSNFFPGTPVEMFWTSTPYVNNPANAWVVDFGDGSALHSRPTSAPHRARCVRGG